jgi:glycosyltransferase involved in cell wall biosynthesis
MVTSSAPRCGIASYSTALLAALDGKVTLERLAVPGPETSPVALDALAERASQADVIHLQHEFTFFNGYLPNQTTLFRFAEKLRRPVVLTAHSVLSLETLMHLAEERRPMRRLLKQALTFHPGLRRAVEQAPYALAAAVIAHTDACVARLTRAGIPKERVHRIPAGVPALAAEEPLDEALIAFLARPTVAIPGFVTPNKGYEVALDALARLPEEVGLLVAGGARVDSERPYLESLEQEIDRRGLAGRVRITGYLPEGQLAAVLRRATVAALPHREATGSYSVMLPLAAGRAIVASDLACFREIARESGGVTLAPPGDPEALARALGELLANAERRAEAEAASRTFAASHSWERVAERTVAVYRSVVGSVT